MKKAFWGFLLILLVVSAAFSVATKRSFTDLCNDETAQDSAIVNSVSSDIPGKNTDESDEYSASIKNLLSADLIAEVEPVGKTKWEYYAGLVSLKIKKVYKGSEKEGKIIDCFERAFFTESEEKMIFGNMYLFTPMKEGKAYIIFARKKSFYPAYEKTLERKVYVLKNDDVSFFSTDMTEPPILSKKKSYTYEEIKNYEFLCYSKYQRDGINSFKKSLMNELEKTGKQ